jgi:hypothetical protein
MDYLIGKSLGDDVVDEQQQVIIKKETPLTSEDLQKAKEKKLLHKIVFILEKEKVIEEVQEARKVTAQKFKEVKVQAEIEAREKTQTLQEKISQKIRDWKKRITKRKEG